MVALLLISNCAPSQAAAFLQSIPSKATTTRRSSSVAAFTVGEAIDNFYQTQPYVSAFLTCSFKASAADFFAQKKTQDDSSSDESMTSWRTTQQENKDDSQEVDVSRNLVFLFYGGVYQGLCQQFMYVTLFPAWFGHLPMLQSVALQVATDMAVIGPFLYLPTFYAVKSIFTYDNSNDDGTGLFPSLDTLRPAIREGLEKYREDVFERNLLLKFWALWIPVSCLTFGVVPHHLRVVFVAAVSFFWVFILSSVSAQQQDTSTATDARRP